MYFSPLKSTYIIIACLTSLILMPPVPGAGQCCAAEFQLSDPGIELRRIQICRHCGKPLIVTSIAPGAAVRCPHCEHVQRRLPDSELQVKVYQICPSCSSRLDVSRMNPFEAFKCGSCGFEQRVLPEAVYTEPTNAGTGKIPAEKSVAPAPAILPPSPREIPEPAVPGLNMPESPVTEDFSIELDSAAENQSETPHEQDNLQEDTEKEGSEAVEQQSFLNLPQINPQQNNRISITVNGQPVYENEIMRVVLKKLEEYQLNSLEKPQLEERKNLYDKFRTEAENELINNLLILQQAKRERIIPAQPQAAVLADGTSSELQENSTDIAACRKALLEKHISDYDKPTTAELLKYYNQHPYLFSMPDLIAFESVTVFKDRTGRQDRRSAAIISREIREQLNYDVSFPLIARRYSEDVFSADDGQIRGVKSKYIPANNIIKPLRKDRYSLKSGDIFGPMDLPSCKLFVRISDIKRGKLKDFETVKAEVTEIIRGSSREKQFESWLNSIRKAAIIEYKK